MKVLEIIRSTIVLSCIFPRELSESFPLDLLESQLYRKLKNFLYPRRFNFASIVESSCNWVYIVRPLCKSLIYFKKGGGLDGKYKHDAEGFDAEGLTF